MMEPEIIQQINKTREYLDYIETHVLNVQRAWEELKEKCRDMRFIWDDFVYWSIEAEILSHDLSKMSEFELVQYRRVFFPTKTEQGVYDLGDAWEHHKDNNPHHWENWTKRENEWEINCVHMVCDWIAMGYEFKDNAQQYYEKNKKRIKLPVYAVVFIYEIFNRIYPMEKE